MANITQVRDYNKRIDGSVEDELTKLMDALEAASPGRTNSPREYMMGRANMVQQLVASWQK